MIRYTPERGYGLDLSGPEPVWRGERPGWSGLAADMGLTRNPVKDRRRTVEINIARYPSRPWHAEIPRYRIDEYIKRGLIDPARRDDL